MNKPRITFLVHGGLGSVAAVRARGLTQQYDSDRVRMLLRTDSRIATARQWLADLHADPPDLIYVLNTGVPGSAIALEERWLRQIPYVLDTGDLIYEMARRSGINAGLRLPLLGLTERAAERAARAIVVRGTRHEEYLRARGYSQVTVIRDGFEPARPVPPAEHARLRSRLGLDDAFVVGVMGSLVHSPRLDICYGWDLIRAIARMTDLPVRGLIIGDGPGRAWLEQLACEQGVSDRIVFVGRIPYETVPLYLQLMDVALSTQTNNLPGRVRTTGKLPEYMAAARFVLASRVGEAALVLPDTMLVEYRGEVDSDYPRKLEERIRALVEDPSLLEIRHELPPIAERLFSYDVLSDQFNDLVASL